MTTILICIGGALAFIGCVIYLLGDKDENGEPRERME